MSDPWLVKAADAKGWLYSFIKKAGEPKLHKYFHDNYWLQSKGKEIIFLEKVGRNLFLFNWQGDWRRKRVKKRKENELKRVETAAKAGSVEHCWVLFQLTEPFLGHYICGAEGVRFLQVTSNVSQRKEPSKNLKGQLALKILC